MLWGVSIKLKGIKVMYVIDEDDVNFISFFNR